MHMRVHAQAPSLCPQVSLSLSFLQMHNRNHQVNKAEVPGPTDTAGAVKVGTWSWCLQA